MPRECASATLSVAKVHCCRLNGENDDLLTRTRRGTHSQVNSSLDRRRIGAVVAVDEPPHHTIRQVVGRTIADPSRSRIDYRTLQRDHYHLGRPKFCLGIPDVVQNRMPQIIVIASRFGERQCKKLAQVVSTTGGELNVRFGGSAHIHLFAGSGALRPQRNSVGAGQQLCSQVFDRLCRLWVEISSSDVEPEDHPRTGG